jgi:hypothetical protein
MKKYFVTLLAALLAVPSFAQFTSGGFDMSKENLYYGVRLGMTSASLSGDFDTDSKIGMTLAGVVGLRVSESTPLFLESGLYYTERGAKDIGYNNLEIPIVIKYGISASDDIAILPFIGPYFSYAISGKTKQPNDAGKMVKVGTFDEDKAVTGGLNRANMGFKIGCGAEYNKMYLEIGYQFGVSNIAKNENLDGIHSNAFFANFGINF